MRMVKLNVVFNFIVKIVVWVRKLGFIVEVVIMKIEVIMVYWWFDKKEDFNKDIFNVFFVYLSLIMLFLSWIKNIILFVNFVFKFF